MGALSNTMTLVGVLLIVGGAGLLAAAASGLRRRLRAAEAKTAARPRAARTARTARPALLGDTLPLQNVSAPARSWSPSPSPSADRRRPAADPRTNARSSWTAGPSTRTPNAPRSGRSLPIPSPPPPATAIPRPVPAQVITLDTEVVRPPSTGSLANWNGPTAITPVLYEPPPTIRARSAQTPDPSRRPH